MRIGIIGAGFTGLASAYYLAKAGHQVTVLEKEHQPGGLAIGFQDPNWDWPLESHYHHLFSSDTAIQGLASAVNHPISFSRPVTATYYNSAIYQLDSPQSLLSFPPLSLVDRLRTAAGLALLRFNPLWRPFEYLTAKNFIRTVMGLASWSTLWEPLFVGKFGEFADQISAAWFWSRVFKRSPSLGYPQGGFQSLAASIEAAAKHLGANFIYQCPTTQILSQPHKTVTCITDSQKYHFDRVICTLPTPQFSKLTNVQFPRLQGLGAVNLVLSLSKDFLPKGVYWLNINDRSMPFLAVVEHTHFQSPSHYAGNHLIYVGNYLPATHPYFTFSAQDLAKLFLPHLQKINPHITASWITNAWVFKAPFAQPIVTTRYSKLIPSMTTPLPNVFLANIQQVYPWDRGTNYAVELGQIVASLCLS
jgi:protoporphyrinogen oxidase